MAVASHVWFLLNSKQCFRIGFFFKKSSPLLPPRRPPTPLPRSPRGARGGAAALTSEQGHGGGRTGGSARVLGGVALVPPAAPHFKLSGRCQRGYASALSPTSESLSERSPLGPASPLWRHTGWEPMVPKTSRGDRPPHRKTFLASGFFPPSHCF